MMRKKTTIFFLLLTMVMPLFSGSFFSYPERKKGVYTSPVDPVENVDITDIAMMELLRSSSYLTLYDNSIWPKAVDPLALEQPIGSILGSKFAHAPQKNYMMPVSFIKTMVGGSNKPGFLIPNQDGLQMQDITFITDWGGRMLLADRALFHWEFRHTFTTKEVKHEIHKLYLKYKMGKLSFEGGKDSIKLGPGAYGMLLDNSADPYWMVKVQTDKSLVGGGYWDFIFMHGWLKDQRDDYNNPKLMAARLTWRMPGVMDFIRLGATHTLMYGGDGREKIKPYELPWLFLGVSDNQPQTKYDADSFGSIDLTIFIPFHRINPKIRHFSLYLQEGGTDIKAVWQIEDAGEFAVPYGLFRFYEREYIVGMAMGLEHHAFRLEYSKTAYSFYQHHMYPKQGYSYNGVSLGDPVGNNFQRILFRHSWIPSRQFSLMYEIGYYQGPAHSHTDHEQKWFATSPIFSTGENIFHRGYLHIDTKYSFYPFRVGFVGKIDGGDGHDANDEPAHIEFSPVATLNFSIALSFDIIF
ncbi:hypothetical protein KAH37_04500 [bacterium]|nr:hypothetical protein [bacterium]